MNIQKLQIADSKSKINLKFYFYLKYTTKLKPTKKQLSAMLEIVNSTKIDTIYGKTQSLENLFTDKSPHNFSKKHEIIREILFKCENFDDFDLLSITLRLYIIKDLLLTEAKIPTSDSSEKLKTLDPLSLEYDNISLLKPYAVRVKGALLSLMCFEKLSKNETNFMSEDSYEFLEQLAKDIKKFQEQDLEPNQIFMLMFSEAINQSITSESGIDYEDRIFSILSNLGIENITKGHDKNDNSTEYDFLFELNGKTYGIGAKRTLRERYKQFIKTALNSKIDVTIEITLGTDLSYEKAKTITQHNTFLFVADEIYQRQKFLSEMDNVFSVKDLTLECLHRLGSNS